MARTFSRRRMLKTGAAATGAIIGSTVNTQDADAQSSKGPGREASWGPGPDVNLVRDLTPGSTPVRLAGHLGMQEGQSIGTLIENLRKEGHTSAVTSPDPWHGMSDSGIRELRAALKQHDVTIFEVGGYRNLLHTDEAKRRENLAHIVRSLEAAEKIGCPMVGTISGSRNPEGNQWGDNYAVHPDNWTLETWKLLISGIKQILADTKGLKSVIGMEAQVTTNIDTPLSHKRLMEDVGSDRVKVNLDPTNMTHLLNHFHTPELINECFDLLGEDIMGCHAKDSYVVPHEQTVHVQEVCPGRGSLDYETYLVRLSKMKWPRALLPEHIPADQYTEAYDYIRNVAKKVGVTIYG